jgi:hypothetical protein
MNSRLREAIRNAYADPWDFSVLWKDSPSPPAPPDPYATARAQGTENRETAIAQGVINNPNINTPFGSQRVTWGTPGTPGTADSFDQAGYDAALAQFNNPTSQPGVGPGYFDWSKDETNPVWVSQAPGGTAPNRSDFITRGTPGTPGTDASGAPGGVQQPTIDQTLSPAGQAQLDQQNRIIGQLGSTAESGLGRVNDAMSQPFDMSGVPGRTSSIGQQNYASGVNAGQLQTGYGSGGQIRYDSGYNQPIQNSLYGPSGSTAREAYAPDETLAPGMARTDNGFVGEDGTRRGGGRSPFGNVQTSFGDAGNVQGGVDTSPLSRMQTEAQGGQIQGQVGDGGQIQRGLDYSGVSRMPTLDDFGKDRDRIEQAINSRLEPQMQRDEDAMRQRLANQGLTLNHEAYARDQDAFGRQKNDARMQTILAGAGEQSRLFNQAMAARQQGVGEVNTQGNYANQAQGQAYSQGLASGQFANAAQAQGYGQNLSNANLGNQALQAQYQGNLSAGQFANAAQGQRYAQELGRGTFANQGQEQQFAQGLAGANFANAAQQQGFNQAQTNMGAYNQAQAQANAQNANQAQFANTAMQNQFGMGQQNAALQNQAATLRANENLQNANLGNQNRQQAIQEQAYLRQLPLNEINALRSGNQITMPQFQQFQGSQIAPAPIAQSVNNAYQQQLAGYNADQASNASFTSGLFNLAGAGIGAFAL